MEAEYLVRATGCYRCSLKCDRYSRVNEGEFAGVEVGGPEYSTAVALGPGLGIDNMAAILKGNDSGQPLRAGHYRPGRRHRL